MLTKKIGVTAILKGSRRMSHHSHKRADCDKTLIDGKSQRKKKKIKGGVKEKSTKLKCKLTTQTELIMVMVNFLSMLQVI